MEISYTTQPTGPFYNQLINSLDERSSQGEENTKMEVASDMVAQPVVAKPVVSQPIVAQPVVAQATGGGLVASVSLGKRQLNFGFGGNKKSRLSGDPVLKDEPKTPRPKPKSSFNLKSLSLKINTTTEPHLKNYFKILSKLLMLNSDKLMGFYYEGSTMTFSEKAADHSIMKEELVGDEQIYIFLCRKLALIKKYNVQFFNIQPSLGHGDSVFLSGTMGTVEEVHKHRFTMSINFVRLRKKCYIQNQFFHVE